MSNKRTCGYLFCIALASMSASCATLLDLDERVAMTEGLVTLERAYESGDALEAAYAGRDYLLIGETHYVAEHQAFWSARFGSLADAGYRVFAQEGQAAFSWLVEAYSLGEELAIEAEQLITQSEEVYGFDQAWLRALRAENLERPAGERLAFAYFDINHWPDSFLKSVSIMLRASGTARDAAPAWLLGLLALRSGTPEYVAALEAAIGLGGEAGAALGLGGRWDARLARMLRDELVSARLRARWDDDRREDFIEASVLGLRRRYGDAPIAVNCGMYHAQLESQMGSTTVFLGERLLRRAVSEGRPGSSICSLAVIALSGDRIDRFNQRDSYRIDATASGRPGQPIYELAKAAAARPDVTAWFLALEGDAWGGRRYRMDYSGNPVTVRPGMQFSAIVALPRVGVNPGLSIFRK